MGNVVLMGSGEPLDNYDNVMKFLRLMNDARRAEYVAARRVALDVRPGAEYVSTWPHEGLPVTLSVSLHAPNDEIRRKLMPVARAYAMEDGAGRPAATMSIRPAAA